MKSEKEVKSFEELYDALRPYSGKITWIFRGQRNDPKWRLVPKAGRNLIKIGDKGLFYAWKRDAIAYEQRELLNDWDWLTIAQHHGLTTRLLDWTLNPLVAVFFAIKHSIEKQNIFNGVVFAYFDKKAIRVGPEMDIKDPFEVKKKISKVIPRSITKRLIMQSGLFTIHTPAENALEDFASENNEIKLEKIIIKKEYLNELLIDLSFFGINEKTLFPDYDGLSSYLNWLYRKK